MLGWTVGWLAVGRRRAGLSRLRGILVADLVGGVVFLAAAYLLAIPHQRVLAAHPDAQRVEGMLGLFSPPWYGLLTANSVNRVWAGSMTPWRAEIDGHLWPPEMYMSPGILLLGLGVAGLFISAWPLRRRLLRVECACRSRTHAPERTPSGLTKGGEHDDRPLQALGAVIG